LSGEATPEREHFQRQVIQLSAIVFDKRKYH
jgi:hypothetical protein